VRQEIIGDFKLFRVHCLADRVSANFIGERPVAGRELLDLTNIIGQGFSGRVDGCQTATDNHGGESDLQVGE